MKKSFILTFLCLSISLCYAQKKISTDEFKGLTTISWEWLINQYFFERITQNQDEVNHPSEVVLLNNRYIKNFIGVNKKSIFNWEKSHYKDEFKGDNKTTTFWHEGRSFKTVWSLLCPEYDPELVSLWELKKIYAPDAPVNKCLFLVDNYLLTTDLSGFRFDKECIDQVIVTPPEKIHSLKKGKYLDVYLIHFYTKNKTLREKPVAFSTSTRDSIFLDSHDYKQVNWPSQTVYLNSTYVKSFIGLNIDSLKRMPAKDLRIESSASKLNIISKRYKPELISPEEIANKYLPNAVKDSFKVRCIYMINNMPLLSDLSDIRIDKNYIHTIRLFQPSELELLGGGLQKVAVICIYTKDQATLTHCFGLRINDPIPSQEPDVLQEINSRKKEVLLRPSKDQIRIQRQHIEKGPDL